MYLRVYSNMRYLENDTTSQYPKYMTEFKKLLRESYFYRRRKLTKNSISTPLLVLNNYKGWKIDINEKTGWVDIFSFVEENEKIILFCKRMSI